VSAADASDETTAEGLTRTDATSVRRTAGPEVCRVVRQVSREQSLHAVVDRPLASVRFSNNDQNKTKTVSSGTSIRLGGRVLRDVPRARVRRNAFRFPIGKRTLSL